MNKHFIYLIVAVASVAAMMLTGCGGGAGSSGAASRGALSMVIHWPEAPSRLIPVASNSIVVNVTAGGQQVATQTVPRPPQGTNVSTVTFNTLQPGAVTVTATAYPTTTGTGVPQAANSITATVQSGKTITTPDLVMNSTVATLTVVSDITTLNATKQATLTVTALDGASPPNQVLVDPSQVKFTSDDAGAFTIVQNGLQATITANLTGIHGITVTYTEPNPVKTGTISFNIGAAPPASANVYVLDNLNARVVGLGDTAPGASFTPLVQGTTSTVSLNDMATDAHGNIFLAEGGGAASQYPQIVCIDSANNFVGAFTPQGTLSNGVQYGLVPYQMCLDPQGHIYFHVQVTDPVTGRINNMIYRVDSITGYPATLKQVQLPFQIPVGMASDGQYFYTTDGKSIYRINADLSGSWSAAYGTAGSGQDNFKITGNLGSGNHALGLDPSGTHLYVADYNNSRIVQITTAGFNSLPSTSGFNFTDVSLSSTGANGATTFKPISVAVDGTNQHVIFSGIEVKDSTQSDAFPPHGNNVVNSYTGRFDVSGVASHTATNRMLFGGAIILTGANNQFGKPSAISAK